VNRTADCASAVEALYTIFESYSLHANTRACPCCHTPADEGVLHAKPLRELSAKDLQMYTRDAILVWGSEADFKHFLPRIFELMTTVRDPMLDFTEPPWVFAKLRLGHWENWAITEQEAVRHYFATAWHSFLRSDPDNNGFTDSDDWICGIGQAEDDLRPYFALWEAEKSIEAVRHLCSLILDHAFVQVDARAQNFWADRKTQWAQVRQWLSGDAVRQILNDASSDWRNDALDLAIQVLRPV
jgi:hypothetical protein